MLFLKGISLSQEPKDTIDIKEVQVNYKQDLAFSNSGKTYLDPLTIKDYQTKDLSDLLSENSPVYIKSYGNGGVASSSVRGAGASHTLVTWNGIKINSPMPGQLDFSQIPAFFIDEAEIIYGGGSLSDYSGALGGSIDLINKPDWDNLINVGLSQEFGSYNTRKSQVSTAFGKEKYQAKTKMFYTASKNNFEFLNEVISHDPVLQERKNASFSKKGIIQEFYVRPSSSNIFSAKIWYQTGKRYIPEPIIINPVEGNQKQKDDLFNSQLNWKYYNEKMIINTTAAWFYDYLNYTNKIADIDSKNTGRTATGRFDLSYDLQPHLQLTSGILGSHTNVISKNYTEPVNRKHLSAYFSVNKQFKDVLKLYVMVRQDVYDGEIVPLIPSAGFALKPIKKIDLELRGNISKNYHEPSLNDQYWNPGGNPDLKEETGTTGEFTLGYKSKSNAVFLYQSNITAYRSRISNWIQWQPGEYGYWEPVNMKEVLSRGIEFAFNCQLDVSEFTISSRANYAYTLATNIRKSTSSDLSVDKQLVYVPEHQVNAHLEIVAGAFEARYYHRYTGKRFITLDNSDYLPSYHTGDLSFAFLFSRGDHKAKIEFTVNNLWDKEYQVIAYYPVPGRSYFLSIRYFFNKQKT